MSKYEVTQMYEPEDFREHWLLELLDRPIAYHRIFAQLTDSVTAGVMLSQAFYWARRPNVQARGGWFYKSAKEWQEETCLTPQEQRTARKRLNEFDWWQEETKKAQGAPTKHYRINLAAFARDLKTMAQQQMDLLPATNGNVENNNSELLVATNPIYIDYTENNNKEGAPDLLPTRMPSRKQQQAAEHVKAARGYGLEPAQFVALVDAYLEATNGLDLANTDTPEGDTELLKAKNTAVAGLQMGIKTPADVRARLAGHRQQWNENSVPAYSQLLKAKPATNNGNGKRARFEIVNGVAVLQPESE